MELPGDPIYLPFSFFSPRLSLDLGLKCPGGAMQVNTGDMDEGTVEPVEK